MNTKLFRKYIRNYLSILAILLVLLMPLYRAMYQGTKELIVKDAYNKLQQGAIDLENRVSKMRMITNLLCGYRDVEELAKVKGEEANKKYVRIMATREYLVNCMSLGMEDSEAYIMFKDNDLVITTTSVISSITYHDYSSCGIANISFEEFRKNIFGNKTHLQFMSYGQETSGNGILCIYKDFSNKHLEYDTAVGFKIPSDIVGQILNIDTLSPNDMAYIADAEGNIIYRVNYEGDPFTEETISAEEIYLDRQKYTLLQVEAENCGLKIIMGISNKTIDRGINNVNQIVWLYIAISIVCMLLFCIYWAVKRAVSVREVLKSLKYDEGNGEKFNEFKEIARGINKLNDENEAYKEKIAEIQKSISNSMLEKLLLRGVYSQREIEEINDSLRWSMEFYCVVCVNTRLKSEEEVLNLFCRSDDFFAKHFACISASVERNERVYIIHMSATDAPDTKEIANLLKELAADCENMWIGISSIGTGLENVRLCYQQAKLVARQIFDKYDTNIAMYREPEDGSYKLFKLNLENRIYDLILAEETDAIRKSFDKIRFYARKNYWSSEQEVMRFFFEVQNPVARIWDELGQKSTADWEFPVYQADKTIMELIVELEETSYYLCECIRKNKESSKTEFNNKMFRFVEENYMNKEMCVSYAAAYLGISDKYFMTLYKEQTGRNFGAYVETRRLKQAEKYLLETDWSMGRIADAVGYSTVDAFYKSFKKNYGLAPGKWKESRK